MLWLYAGWIRRLKRGSGSKKIPEELQSYITPPGGGTFVAPPMLGFTRGMKKPSVKGSPVRLHKLAHVNALNVGPCVYMCFLLHAANDTLILPP